MAQITRQLDLGGLLLSPGEGVRLHLEVGIDPLILGGERYSVSGPALARLDVSRTTAGYALRLRATAPLEGACMRCLDPAERSISFDAREVDQPGGGEDLSSPYLDGGDLDLHSWARDALALALPVQIVCRDECRGLCPVCGENLNEAGPKHAHEPEPDPRWAALRELRLE